ncbi:MAG: response regulator [Candidatus Micrarchaeia archaeon]
MARLLIVEDEKDVAETMKMLVESRGHKADIMLEPEKGLAKAAKYDLILLDIMMPKMTGRQFLAKMKERGIRTKVIVISAIGLPDEVARELEAKYPGTGFVPKTDMADMLLPEIERYLGR